MGRKQMERVVNEPPLFTEFKPTGIAKKNLSVIELSLDEFEAIRLADGLNMSHEESASKMVISRPTFSRLIDAARKKIASYLLKGKLLKIGGGNIHFRNNILKCIQCGHLFKTNMVNTVSACPECSANELINLASDFGHGQCCQNQKDK